MINFVVYGQPDCPYCDKAIAILEEFGLSYVYHDIKNDLSARKHLIRMFPELKTVPQIYYDETHIGGFDDLRTYLE